MQLQRYLHPETDQQAFMAPLQPYVRTENLSEEERFYLADFYFFSLFAKRSYDAYAAFMDRTDWIGRTARVRRMAIEINAFQDFGALERSIRSYRAHYAPDPELGTSIGYGERNLCQHMASHGRDVAAVAFVLESIAASPRGTPASALSLLSACFDSFERTGKQQLAFDRATEARTALAARLASRANEASRHPAYDPLLFENVVEDQWYGRSSRAPYNYVNFRLQTVIRKLDDFLACRRDHVRSRC
jgi:hypothetical protein